jgi:membrane protein implicated in regulation of membrane protease activity
MVWWQWALIGFGGILAELALPAFVLVWFGLAGLLVMLLTLVMPGLDTTFQLFVWAILSLGLIAAWFRFFKQSHKTLVGSASAHIVGEVGLLTEPVAPFQKGRVRFQKPILGSDQWECTSDEVITVGERVKVTSVDGSLMAVAKVKA